MTELWLGSALYVAPRVHATVPLDKRHTPRRLWRAFGGHRDRQGTSAWLHKGAKFGRTRSAGRRTGWPSAGRVRSPLFAPPGSGDAGRANPSRPTILGTFRVDASSQPSAHARGGGGPPRRNHRADAKASAICRRASHSAGAEHSPGRVRAPRRTRRLINNACQAGIFRGQDAMRCLTKSLEDQHVPDYPRHRHACTASAAGAL